MSPTAAEESANPGSDGDPHPIEIEAEVDYVFRDGSSLVAARFVPTLARSASSGIDPGGRATSPASSSITSTARATSTTPPPSPRCSRRRSSSTVSGVRDRLDLGGKTCRYVQIPLADRSRTSVNWVRESVETSLEIADLTDVYVDQHTYGLTHEHRNETVDGRLAAIVERIGAGEFDPTDRWDHVRRTACPDCGYAVCCQDHIASEVQFDG